MGTRKRSIKKKANIKKMEYLPPENLRNLIFQSILFSIKICYAMRELKLIYRKTDIGIRGPEIEIFLLKMTQK